MGDLLCQAIFQAGGGHPANHVPEPVDTGVRQIGVTRRALVVLNGDRTADKAADEVQNVNKGRSGRRTHIEHHA